jgi:hypothetical protein
MVIILVKVPGELYEQARYTDHLCEHLYQKVARGAKIQDHDIGSIGSHRHLNDDYKAALCLNCGYAYIERRFTGFEVAKNTPPVPIKEMPLFKDVMKK